MAADADASGDALERPDVRPPTGAYEDNTRLTLLTSSTQHTSTRQTSKKGRVRGTQREPRDSALRFSSCR